jgi:hypothetical protein
MDTFVVVHIKTGEFVTVFNVVHADWATLFVVATKEGFLTVPINDFRPALMREDAKLWPETNVFYPYPKK